MATKQSAWPIKMIENISDATGDNPLGDCCLRESARAKNSGALMNAMTLRITSIPQSKKQCQTRTRLLTNLPELKQKILEDFVRTKMHKTLLAVFRGAITA